MSSTEKLDLQMALLRSTGPVGRNVACRLHTKSDEDISNERTSLLHFLTPRSGVFLQELTGSQLVKKNSHFMESEVSLPHSQVPTTCPYPEPDQSRPYPPTQLPKYLY